jgi:hypothetical protein
VLPAYRRVVIRGEAGAGKSTLLQWLAIKAARQDFTGDLAPWNDLVPFFIRLRRRVNRGFPAPAAFCEEFAQHFEMPADRIEELLHAGHALVLIDGVDELPRSQRPDFLEALRRLVRDYPNATYLITSRPGGLKSTEGGTWDEWEQWTEQAQVINLLLEPMSISDMAAFVGQWHHALAEARRKEDRGVDLDATAANLQRLLDRRPELRRLATTPLLCGMICLLHRERGETLPQARLQLYYECVEMLINRRDVERKIPLDEVVPTGLNERQKWYLLQDFAYWLQRKHLTSAERAEADEHFGKMLPLMNLPGDVTGQHITTLFLERAGLLREPVVGQVDFAHRTLQEYLAAQAAVDDDDIATLLHNAANDQWRETIIAAAGLANKRQCKELLAGLLEQAAAPHDDPDEPRTVGLLAVACLETAERVPPDLRAAIIAQARSYIPPQSDEEAAQLAKAGDPIVPLLAHQPAHSPREAANCVRALAQIGTTAAMEMLAGYTRCDYEGEYEEVEKDEATGSLGQAWIYFDRQEYAKKILTRIHKLGSEGITVPITCWEDISTLTHFEELHIEMPDDITDINPLTAFINLYRLSLGGTGISDLTPLVGLTNLQSLWLYDTIGSDLPSLLGLTNLQTLTLVNAAVSDLTPLSSLTNLQTLTLVNAAVSDLTPLSSLTNLQFLLLLITVVRDLTPLAGLTNLEMLFLENTAVSDLTPLAGLTNLQTLWLQDTAVSDLTPLVGLTSLQRLDLDNTAVSDLTPLAGLTNLQALLLDNTAVSDLTPLAGLTNLQRLDLDNTAVSDLTPLAGLTNLRELYLSGTEADTAPLKHLEQLEIYR